MELMSSLLLCALAAALPQALGTPSRSSLQSEILVLLKPNVTAHKLILLNPNGPPLVNTATEMQSVFKDAICRECLNCMERAIKAHLKHSHFTSLHQKHNLDELYYNVLNENHPIQKRSVNITNPDGKSKPKSHSVKSRKGVTVTKYYDDNGKVHALKVKELSSKNGTDSKKYTCKVYSVKKSMPCETFGVDVTVETPAKKVKRDKKSKHRNSTSKLTGPTITTPPYKRREIYNAEVPESYMPSLEDMY